MGKTFDRLRLVVRSFACATLTFGVSACDLGSPMANEAAASGWNKEASEVPAHRYAEERDGVYYYISAVSDNDRASGRATGDVVGFRFLGTNRDGEYILVVTNARGGEMGREFCKNPCAIVRSSDGQMQGFNEESLVGAAFQDAFSGQMKRTKLKH